MMQIGSRENILTLKRMVLSAPDEYNHRSETWQNVGNVWAAKYHVKDSERFSNSAVISEVELRFNFRWSTLIQEIDATWLVEFDGRIFEIIGAPKFIGRKKEIEISCKARAEN